MLKAILIGFLPQILILVIVLIASLVSAWQDWREKRRAVKEEAHGWNSMPPEEPSGVAAVLGRVRRKWRSGKHAPVSTASHDPPPEAKVEQEWVDDLIRFIEKLDSSRRPKPQSLTPFETARPPEQSRTAPTSS